MNILPTYEQMIAERMEGIEIPDMADAIWSRIEAALDVELPVEDKPGAAWVIGAGIIAIIIIVLFFLLRPRSVEPAPQRNLPQQSKPDTVRKEAFKPPDKPKPAWKKTIKPIPQIHVVDTPVLSTPPAIDIPPPVFVIPPPVVMDSLLQIKPRKKYGVEVSDSDYRMKAKPKH